VLTRVFAVFYHNFTKYATEIVATKGIILNGIVSPARLDIVETLTLLIANAQFTELRELIASDPNIRRKDEAEGIIIAAAQEAFALGYRYPYWYVVLLLLDQPDPRLR
jgi:hypothetical protein